MNTGYFQGSYWQDGYWNEYWPVFGMGSPIRIVGNLALFKYGQVSESVPDVGGTNFSFQTISDSVTNASMDYTMMLGTWTEIAPKGIDPSSTNVSSSYNILDYNDDIYLGTFSWVYYAQVWKRNHLTFQWEKIWNGNNVEWSINGMIFFNNELYVGTWCDLGAAVYKYDGTSWTMVSAREFGQVGTYGSAVWLEVYQGTLYAAYYSQLSALAGGRANVFRYDGGTTWTKVSDDGFGEAKNSKAHDLFIFNGELYVTVEALRTDGGCTLWKYNGGTSWSKIGTNGLGDSNNYSIEAHVVFNGKLYMATVNTTTGIEVWEYDGSTLTQVNTDGFGLGKQYLGWLTEYGGNLFLQGARVILRWAGGTTWEPVKARDLKIPSSNAGGAVVIYHDKLITTSGNDATYFETWQYDPLLRNTDFTYRRLN